MNKKLTITILSLLIIDSSLTVNCFTDPDPSLNFDQCDYCGTGTNGQISSCRECKKGYFPTNKDIANQGCTKCHQACQECTDGTKCTKCGFGHYEEVIAGQDMNCHPCSDAFEGCGFCSNSKANCDSCLAGYNHVPKAGGGSSCTKVIGCKRYSGVSTQTDFNGGICLECEQGFHSRTSTGCSPCPSGCATCTSASTCTAAIAAGFWLDSATAKPCLANCETCTNGEDCSKCKAGYGLVKKDGVLSCEVDEVTIITTTSSSSGDEEKSECFKEIFETFSVLSLFLAFFFKLY